MLLVIIALLLAYYSCLYYYSTHRHTSIDRLRHVPRGDTIVEQAGLASSLFDIDPRTGFMPREPPLTRLPPKYHPWERALDQARICLKTPGDGDITEQEKDFGEKWRQSIRSMPTIGAAPLKRDPACARRAHHVLAFLTQLYIQSLPPVKEPVVPPAPIRIPSSIAIPFVDISRHLGIAPIVTYADAVLWNWKLDNPYLPLSTKNIRILDLFTQSPMEEHFFLTSARIEIRGVEALELMGQIILDRKIIDDTTETDPKLRQSKYEAICQNLKQLAVVISEIAEILMSVKEGCDPMFFFFTFRPWIRGADQGEASPAWLYEGVDGPGGLLMQCSGPSAGQSALMHAFDVFLGVEHRVSGPSGGCAFANVPHRIDPAFDPHNLCLIPLSWNKTTTTTSPVYVRSPPAGNNNSSIITRTKPSDVVARNTVSGRALEMPPKTPDPHPQQLLTPPSSPLSQSKVGPAPPELPPTIGQEIDTSFISRMRKYMPGSHQNFLTHLANHSIHPFIHSAKADISLVESYQSCLASLKYFRDCHIRIVTGYVICPARSIKTSVYLDGDETLPVRGTGGTSLIPLLKIYRNNTINTGSISPV